MKTLSSRARSRTWVVLVLLLAFGLRVFRLGYQSFWWDEMRTSAFSILPLDMVVDNLLAIRNHVPLYFLLTRAWARIGHGEFVLRFLSTVWGMAGVALIYSVGKRFGNVKVGLGAAFLLAISPFHIWYSQEARMYTMISTCVLLGTWFLIRLLDRPCLANCVGYGLSMLVAVYTHYLAGLALLAHYVFLSLHYRILKRVFVRWLVCAGIVVALFGVWISVMMLQGGFSSSPIGWIAPARWYEPVLTLLVFAAGTTIDPGRVGGYLALLVCLAPIGLCVVRLTRHKIAACISTSTSANHAVPGPSLTIELLLYWLFVPVLTLWAISLDLPIPQKRSIYMDRYLITSLPAFVLLVSCGLVYLARKWRGALILWACLAVVAGWSLFNLYFDPAYARDDWRSAIAYIEAEGGQDEVVLLRPSHTLPLAYYASDELAYREFPFLFYESEREAFLQQEMAPRMDEIAAQWQRAWLISSADNTNPHGFSQTRNADIAHASEWDAIKAWMDDRYPVLQERRFPGVLLTRYSLASPR